jgi:PII-like signaling protein
MMQLQEPALLLRVFIGEDDRFDGKPLYEAIVLKAREHGLAGATVLRGPLGFGHSSRIHTAKILRLSEDLPVVVEIIDSKQNITNFLPLLDNMLTGGLVSLQKVRILRYGPDGQELHVDASIEGDNASVILKPT